MKFKALVWIMFLPALLFFLAMFYVEVSLYTLLPADQGGMSFWVELRSVWYRSVWFYAVLAMLAAVVCSSFRRKHE